MPTQTTNLDLTLPTPDVDTGWGSTLNTDFVKIDDIFDADGGGTGVGLNVGSSKTAVIRGTLILGDGDGTNTTSGPTIRGPARTGTNNIGSDIRFDASNGTGTGGSGDFVFRTAAPGSSGATANTLQNVFTIKNTGNIGIGIQNPSYPVVINRSTAVDTFVRTVNNQGSGYVGTGSDGKFNMWADSNNGISIGTNNVERFRIGNLGEFGISTTSGGVTTVNNGSLGQFLQSNGNNSPPTWSSPSWIPVGIVQFNGGRYASLTGLQNYGAIRITIVDLNLSVGASVAVEFYDGSGYVNVSQILMAYKDFSNVTTQSPDYIITTYVTRSSVANGSMNGTITLTNFNVAQNTGISSSIFYKTATTPYYGFASCNGIDRSLSAFSGVRLAASSTSATMSGGYMAVEGLAGS